MNTQFAQKAFFMPYRGRLSACVLAALLSACGGGGDGDPALPAAQTLSARETGNSSAEPTYPANSEEEAAYTLLNAERQHCGFGLLAASAPLDAAARAHADYQIIHGLNSHLQNAARYPEGFTGTDPAARVRAQGYTDLGGVTDEFALFLSSDPAQSKRGIGALGIRALLNAPYHLNGLMSGYRDIGVAVRSNQDTGKGGRGIFVQLNPAYKASAGPQLPGSSDIQTYPCEGTTGVNRQLTNETPNPIPGRDLSTSPIGTTVYVAVREGNRLLIDSAAMNHAQTGEAVKLRAPITSANDPHGPCESGCFAPHQAYVVPDAPLQANTGYTVMLSGRNNGSFFSRTFTFSTGSGN